LKLLVQYDEALSNFAFNFNLRRYAADAKSREASLVLERDLLKTQQGSTSEELASTQVGTHGYCSCSPRHRTHCELMESACHVIELIVHP
jgi:hypothetical protein